VQVAIDVRAEQAGVVSKIHVQPGDERAVGTVLLEIDTDPAAVGTASKAGAKPELTRTSAPAAAPAPAPPTHAVQATPSSAAHARKPSIQFRYGKRETASVVAAKKVAHRLRNRQPASLETTMSTWTRSCLPKPRSHISSCHLCLAARLSLQRRWLLYNLVALTNSFN
jgi:pyruvate/2-oxoglutarate dehydrogenase complex dihydrolipoamide acyltransferase (E2) component